MEFLSTIMGNPNSGGTLHISGRVEALLSQRANNTILDDNQLCTQSYEILDYSSTVRLGRVASILGVPRGCRMIKTLPEISFPVFL